MSRSLTLFLLLGAPDIEWLAFANTHLQMEYVIKMKCWHEKLAES